MNSSVYIFGELSSGYTQYPEDSSSDVLKKLYRHCKAPTQIVIHRDGSLMHYCYIRKLDNDKYFGFCIAVNGYYLSMIDILFSLFENTMEKVASLGVIIHFSEDGTLTTSIGILRSEEEELESLTENLRIGFEGFRKISKPLPRTDYGIAKDSIKEHCISDGVQDIVRASYSYGFTYIYKDEDYDTVHMNSYKGVLSRISKERDELKSKCANLSSQLTKAKVQQRNLIWVSLLGAVTLVLVVVVWNKVLFPSEVARYQTDYFLYYGPMQNKEPHGEGVAFYPTDDKDGRRYYIGHFLNGERQDSTAMLYYNNGDYFYGSMKGDKFLRGIFYSNSDKSHFKGTFLDNRPYEGTWYNHEESYKLKDGKMK